MRSEAIGFEMPDEFPTERYDSMVGRILPYHPSVEWGQFVRGWNGLGYRFRAAADASSEFTASLLQYGVAPVHDERYRQERALYSFVMGGQSPVECMGYAVYCSCAIVEPRRFSVT